MPRLGWKKGDPTNRKDQEARRSYYLQNREEILARNRKYYEENKERIREQKRRYYWQNREKLLAKAREYQRKKRGTPKTKSNDDLPILLG